MRVVSIRFVLIGVVAALLAGGPVTAAENAEEVLPNKSGHVDPLIIPAAAFINDGRAAEGGYDFWTTGYLKGEDAGVHFVAQVDLPNGAVINGFSAYLYDNVNESAPCIGLYDEIWIRLIRRQLLLGTYEEVATLMSSGTSSLVQNVPGSVNSSRAVVNNHAYAYYVDVQMCSTAHHLRSVAIDY